MAVQALAVSPDGSVYLTGSPFQNQFQPTAGAFQPNGYLPTLPSQGGSASVIVKMDSTLQNILAATYFGSVYGTGIQAISFDAAGNVLVAGSTPPRGIATRTPLYEAFGPQSTGYLSELTADLSTLLFSSYLGDNEYFGVKGVALGASGSVIIAGATGQPNNSSTPANVYVNSLTVPGPPTLRVDSVLNAASMLDGPLSPGETILVRGAGFASDAAS